jgi:hypothetical protein
MKRASFLLQQMTFFIHSLAYTGFVIPCIRQITEVSHPGVMELIQVSFQSWLSAVFTSTILFHNSLAMMVGFHFELFIKFCTMTRCTTSKLHGLVWISCC